MYKSIRPTQFATAESKLSVYPVPAQNQVSIDTLYGADIKLLNLQGEIIRQATKADRPLMFDISALANGIYIIEATTPKGSNTKVAPVNYL